MRFSPGVSHCLRFFLISGMLCAPLFSSFSLESDNNGVKFALKSVFPTGGRISGPAVHSQKGFILFSEDRYIYIFDSEGSFTERKKNHDKPLPFQTAGKDGIVYKHYRKNLLNGYSLKAINPRGNILWSASSSSPPLCAPVINSSGSIVAVSADGNAVSYSYLGRKRWEVSLPVIAGEASSFSTPENQPLFLAANNGAGRVDGRVYAGFSDGHIFALDDSGNIVKSVNTNGSGITALYAANGKVFVSGRDGLLTVLDSDLNYSASAHLKAGAFSLSSGNAGIGMERSYDSLMLAAVLSNGGAAILDSSFVPVLSRGGGYGYAGTPLFTENAVYFLRESGSVTRYSLADGTSEEVRIPFQSVYGLKGDDLEDNDCAQLSAYNNLVIIGGKDWNIYFFDAENHGREEKGEKESGISGKSEDYLLLKPDNRHLLYINELSLSDDAADREKALSLIADFLSSGRMSGKDENYIISVIEKTALPGSSLIRSKSASLLGSIGTKRTAEILRRILRAETDPFTASEVIRELGRAGCDPDGESIRLFALSVARFPDDERVAQAVTDALKGINNYHGYLPSPDGRALLLKMLELSGNRDLKLKIINVLRSLE